jgi:hypothetical protein
VVREHVVEFAGGVESRTDLLKDCDCLVQPRRLPGHSLPINEATGEGIPCIVLDLPDWKDYPYRVKSVLDTPQRFGTYNGPMVKADVEVLGQLMRSMTEGKDCQSHLMPKLPTWEEFKVQWQRWMEVL